jgi:hypothetical protein
VDCWIDSPAAVVIQLAVDGKLDDEIGQIRLGFRRQQSPGD